MNRVRGSGHLLAGLLIVSAFESTARADGDSDKAVAEALFRDARQLMEAGDVASACPKFAESLAIDRTLGTLLYLAACHEQQGRTATAWSEFSSAHSWAERSSQGERLAFAQKHIEAIEPRLSFILINAPLIAGLQLKIDDSPLSAAAVGTPLPVDPGSHAIEASAPNTVAWHETIVVPAQPGKTMVEVPPLAPAPAVTPAPAPVAAPAASVTTAEAEPSGAPESSGGSGHKAAAWTAVGVGVAGIAVGSIFGVLTFTTRDSAQTACPNNLCGPGGLDDIDRAKTFATVSTIGFGVGLVGAVVAGYLFLTDKPGETAHHGTGAHKGSTALETMTVAPAVSSHEAGLSLQARFE